MPTWGEVLNEVKTSAEQRKGQPDFDGIRRKYLKRLHDVTGRDTILYSTDWLSGGGVGTSISLEDMIGMMEVCKGLRGPGLDLILHSPGGSAEAAASIVRYLRQKFTDIRVFVPLAAMSAATMIALAGDRIVMGKHSQLGPIDPQLVTNQGQYPARAILEQFEQAKAECAKDPRLLGAWVPIIQRYGPALLKQCEAAEALARRLVGEWLTTYMFGSISNSRTRSAKAKRVADFFSDYSHHRSHSLGIDRDQARAKGVIVDDLEEDEELQDAVLSVHHAAIHTFAGAAAKLIENHLGRAFVRLAQPMPIGSPAGDQPGNVVPSIELPPILPTV